METNWKGLLRRGGVVGALVVAQVSLVAAGAQAATANVYLDGTTVEYTASSAPNYVTITHVSGVIYIEDTATGVVLEPGATCWRLSDHRVGCDDSGVTGVRVYGNNGNDRINSAMDLPASLWGGYGDDVLAGGDGDDTLRGGPGADRMAGDAGRDGVSYYGETAAVTADIDGVTGDDGISGEGDSIMTDVEDLYGGNGADTLRGDADANYINGNSGNDTIYGYGGNDELRGSTGNDWLDAGDGTDEVYGGDNDDRLRGGAGTDQLFGENGDDNLEGGTGFDSLYGGAGNDLLYGQGDMDLLDGGADGDVCDDPTVWAAVSCE